jgi:FHA domain
MACSASSNAPVHDVGFVVAGGSGSKRGSSFDATFFSGGIGVLDIELLLGWTNGPVAIVAALALISALIMRMIARSRKRVMAPPSTASLAVVDLANVYQQYRTSDTLRKSAAAYAAPASKSSDPFADASARMTACLELLDGSAQRYPIASSSVRIGRHSDNDIILSGETVHRHHAMLVAIQPDVYELQDLGGVNGTRVNGARCAQMLLASGDIIELGDLRARFLVSAGSE